MRLAAAAGHVYTAKNLVLESTLSSGARVFNLSNISRSKDEITTTKNKKKKSDTAAVPKILIRVYRS